MIAPKASFRLLTRLANLDEEMRTREFTHVHHGDAGLVQLVDRPLWWDTDGAYKEPGLFLNDHIDELWKLTLGVVILWERMTSESTGYRGTKA